VSYDAAGAVRWSRTYAGPFAARDWFRNVRVDRSGNVIAAGCAKAGDSDILLVSCWNRDGDLSWERYDGGPDSEYCRALLESSSGDVVLAGARLGLVWVFNPTTGQGSYGLLPVGGFVLGLKPDFRTICLGDGVDAPCPCGNVSGPGAREGCANSSGRGARLTASGMPRLSSDTVILALEGSTPNAPGVYFQGSVAVPTLPFGDGLRCAGGALRRLYSRMAQAGFSSAPSAGDLSLSARSAAAGDVIQAGSSRVYQVLYRDVAATFCPSPLGSLNNSSSAVVITWSL